jgi:hypothetical protein
MSTAQQLLAQALLLPIEERADMVHQLLLSIEPEHESAWQQEITARAQRLAEGKLKTFDWREEHEAIRRKLHEKKS